MAESCENLDNIFLDWVKAGAHVKGKVQKSLAEAPNSLEKQKEER